MVLIHPSLQPLLVPADQVRQFPDNPNNGDIDLIAESMQINGVFQPIIAQVGTGYIIAGNHRYVAMLSLGCTQVPVLWMEVDDDIALRMLAVDNKVARDAIIDSGLMADLLLRMAETERGLLGTGYNDNDLALMLSRLDDTDTLATVEPDIVEEYAKQRSDFECPNCGWSPS
jgi:ParB-like chromosome segregation protein Spo0J